MNQRPAKTILRVLNGEPVWPLPVWIMRQAGRYLPEYRETRKQAGSFLDLCYTPRLAEEVTLQPIRRFGFDAAIMFSDILVIPHALGQDVRFVENEGPKLDPVTSEADLNRLSDEMPMARLAPVFETLDRLRTSLPAGNHPSGLLRRTLDRRQLHDRREGHARPGARAADRLSRSGLHAEADRQAGGRLDRLSDPPGRRGRGSDPDFREFRLGPAAGARSIGFRSIRSAAWWRA